MTLRLEMLQVARLAPTVLGPAADAVRDFLLGQLGDDGGAHDRAGESDLYYTVFALEGLLALRAEPPVDAVTAYLDTFGAGDGLDLVHLACLARCRAAVGRAEHGAAISRNLERYRTGDGGFAAEPGARTGTVYHSFLGLGAFQDLGLECPRAEELADCVAALRARDGGWANTPDLPTGSTTVTAAALTLLRYLGRQAPEGADAWLLARVHPEGGFRAAADTPMPDLLSTATALHALAGLQADLGAVKEPCLDFVDTLWTGEAFCGHWADDAKDAEYTFYALLALGHLSL